VKAGELVRGEVVIRHTSTGFDICQEGSAE
jgi:hypothetical protein